MPPRILTAACAAALAAALAGAPAASADDTVTAAPPNQFLNSEPTIDQGGKVTFNNNDTVQHDVTARDPGPDGKPLFKSELIGPGQSAPVKGTEYLKTGDYAFLCSIHPQMTGTLHVTSAGTPVPRPAGGGGGSGGGSGSGGGQSGADRAKPSVSVKALDRRLSRVRRTGRLRLRVTSNEAATVKLTARAGRRTVGAGTVKLTRSGARAVALRLNAAGRRLVRRSRRVRLSISARAVDGAGNKRTTRTALTLRR